MITNLYWIISIISLLGITISAIIGLINKDKNEIYPLVLNIIILILTFITLSFIIIYHFESIKLVSFNKNNYSNNFNKVNRTVC